MQRTAGSAAFTAAMRSAVKVAIPHLRGTAEATKAILIRPFWGESAFSVGKVTRGRRREGSATVVLPRGTRALDYDSSDTGSPALRHAVKPPRMFATSRPA